MEPIKAKVVQAVAKGFSKIQVSSMGTKLTVATIEAIAEEVMNMPRNSFDIEEKLRELYASTGNEGMKLEILMRLYDIQLAITSRKDK